MKSVVLACWLVMGWVCAVERMHCGTSGLWNGGPTVMRACMVRAAVAVSMALRSPWRTPGRALLRPFLFRALTMAQARACAALKTQVRTMHRRGAPHALKRRTMRRRGAPHALHHSITCSKQMSASWGPGEASGWYWMDMAFLSSQTMPACARACARVRMWSGCGLRMHL